MTTKIASNGDIRGEVPGRTYFYVGGQEYFADQTAAGVIVMRLDDMAKVLAEQFADQSAKLGIPPFNPPALTLVRKGTVSINKWSGEAYYIQAPNGQVSSQPLAVISHDPALKELGHAMARQYEKSQVMVGQITRGHLPTSNIEQILNFGAPVSFAGADLQLVSFDPVLKDQFVLPAQPATIDEVRKKMTKN